MSKQLVIAAAGAVILGPAGFGLVSASTGFLIGSTAASLLFTETQKTQGPRLTDLKVSGTTYGEPIPYIEGTVRTSGQMIWASDRREIATTTEQGKGGGGAESTTYTYEVDILYMLSDCELAGLSRIWINGKLSYNTLPSASVKSAISSLEKTDLWEEVRFYSGAVTQLPDPTYEAAVGLGNAPAYRGRACVLIKSLQLGSSGQIPNLSFEVMRETTTADVSQTFASVFTENTLEHEAVYKNTAWCLTTPSALSDIRTVYKSKNWGKFKKTRVIQVGGFGGTTSEPVWVNTNGKPQFLNYTFDTSFYTDPMTVTTTDPETGVISTLIRFTPGTSANSVRTTKKLSAYDEVQDVYVLSPGVGADQGQFVIIRTPGGSAFTRFPTSVGSTPKAIAAWNGKVYVLYPSTTWVVRRYDYDGNFIDEVADSTNSYGGSGLAPNTGCIRVDSDGQCWVFNEYRGRLFKITTFFEEVSTPSNPIAYSSNLRQGVFYCEETFAAFGYEQAGTFPNFTAEFIFRRFKAPTAVAPTLQAVTERLCARADLDPSQYSASALSTITKPVRSMSISQVTPVRNVIETLAGAYFFGGVLSDKLYFKPRGGASVVTIPYADIGAGEGDAQTEPINLKDRNELEIPAQISLTYSNVEADYNVATEYSDRLITGQTSTSAVQVPLGFTAAEAKGTVDSLVYDSAAARFSTTISLLNEYARIEPTDVITVVDEDGSTYRMRVQRKTESGPVISLDLILDDASALISSGVTSADYTSSTSVASPADTTLRLLDIPLLRDGDDPVGLYVAFAPTDTTWPGSALFKSVDGVTYSERFSVPDKTTMGVTTTALTTWSGGFVFDEASSVTVQIDSGSLSSYTRDQVFDGTAPAYLIGNEIVYACNATLVSADIYTLTGFLRGMRGTEGFMSGHLADEEFTVLSTSGLRREELVTSEIGATRYYKAPTLGRALSTADERSIAFAAVGKLPFAPVNLRGQAGLPEPYFASVGLLLHFNGADGATVTTDSGNFNRTVTMTGATLSATGPKHGSAALNMTAATQVATVGTTVDLQMGSGNFTVEFWAYPTIAQNGRTAIIHHVTNSTLTNIQYLFGTDSGANGWSFQCAVGGTLYVAQGGTQTLNTWQHIAGVRLGGNIMLFVDGVLIQTTPITGSLNAPASATFRVGTRVDTPATYQFIGKIDEVRVTKNVARYLSAFTPPTEEFPDLTTGGGTTITWDRRTRFEKNFTNGYVPLAEDSELYEVDIWSSNTYTTLKRTLTTTTPSVIYTLAQQIADFGVLQTTLYVDVYQVSATVGRGRRLRGVA